MQTRYFSSSSCVIPQVFQKNDNSPLERRYPQSNSLVNQILDRALIFSSDATAIDRHLLVVLYDVLIEKQDICGLSELRGVEFLGHGRSK
jgi:hypothetical protein